MTRYIVDSTFGVSKEYTEAHKIKIVSLKMILDGVSTDEGFEKDWDEFFGRFKASDSFPTTSQPNPDAFIAKIEEIYFDEPDADIIILTIANALSGTVNSARLAKESFKDRRIAVIDSQNAAASALLLLEDLVDFSESGKTFDECVLQAEKLIEKTSIQFIPDSMKYLKKGGRIGTLGALLASIISIKPIFEFKKNIVAIPSKVLGMSKAITEMIKRLPKKIKSLSVVYISENKNVPLIVEKLQNMLGIKNPRICAVSPVMGVHIGIGAVGIACVEG